MSISKKEAKTGYITIRVSQKNFYLAIERIERLGEVKNNNIKSEDVTEQYIDLKARLENAQREEKILLDFLNKAMNVKDMLEIEKELSRIREQIEYYTGQLKYLESRIDYSTITIELSEPRPPAPLPEVDWDATIKQE
jgi:predicted nuclease with TOPRIM domain